MTRPVRIGNAHGFWGDRLQAAAEMLAQEPDLNFVTLDFLAEVSMSILAVQRSRDPAAGWPRDFAEIVRSLAPYWRSGGRCHLVTNAGGLNPLGCARACREILEAAGCADRKIVVVCGDDVLDQVRHSDPEDNLLRNMDTGQPISSIKDRIVTANAYLGARPIADALAQGADLVITGRVADPDAYLSPDVTLSLLGVEVEDFGENRVAVRGACGRAAPPTYKVSATYQDGFRAHGELTVFGADACAKARAAAERSWRGWRQMGLCFARRLSNAWAQGAAARKASMRRMRNSLQKSFSAFLWQTTRARPWIASPAS